jgi:hypothetical protein
MGWFAGTPDTPPHPLALIEAGDIATVAVLTPDGALPVTGAPFTATAAAIAALKTMPPLDSRAVTWGSATMLRAVTRDGLALSLQVKPIDGGAAVRVTADGAPGKAMAEAAAIRGLRLNAYRVGPQLADTLLQRPPASVPVPAGR